MAKVPGQVAVAVGFLTRDPSLIWNTGIASPKTSSKVGSIKDDTVSCAKQDRKESCSILFSLNPILLEFT